MQSYIIKPMTIEFAKQIAKWQYESEYSVYSFQEAESTFKELMNEYYYSVQNNAEELIGYFCVGFSAQVPAGHSLGVYAEYEFIDIGLGLRPDLTGRGLGQAFLQVGINFMVDRYKNHNIRLTVAAFNERAIKVYKRVGFKEDKKFSNGVRDFIVMKMSQGTVL